MSVGSFAWRKPEFAERVAWRTKDQEKKYQDLVADIDARRNRSSAKGKVYVCEDESTYGSLLEYLLAWEEQRPFCLLPKSWPEDLKQQAKRWMQDFSLSLPKDLFYVLPTSGSTGLPKLVLITRENWHSFQSAMLSKINWPDQARVALTFEAAFDPFIAMAFLALSRGDTLVPLSPNERFNIFSFMEKFRINVWASVPSLVSMNWPRKDVSSLSSIESTIFTGEALGAELFSRWQEFAPRSEIQNLYGPVECTVWCALKTYAKGERPQRISIGHGFSQHTTLQSVQGELVVSGAQVAAGYLTEHGMTSFNGQYPTGDLVEEVNEEYYFIGRKDQQVKILGQRVELESIESVFDQSTGFKSICCVDAKENLCLITDQNFDVARFLNDARAKLPKSHLPRFFYRTPHWPVTASGKVDRRLLQEKVQQNQLVPIENPKSSAGSHENS